MSETIFTNGLKVYRPNPKAPEFIKLNMVFDKREFIMWLNTQMDNEIRVDLKESKDGILYCALNTYKKLEEGISKPPQASQTQVEPKVEEKVAESIPYPTEPINLEDIPF